mgnify:CR=1 FL=1
MTNEILKDIIDFLTKALKYFQPFALSMGAMLAVIDIVYTFMWGEVDAFKTLVAKMLRYSFFFWLILEYKTIVMNWFINGAIQLGNYAVGNTSIDLLVSPFKFFFDFLIVLAPFVGGGGVGMVVLDKIGIESVPVILGLVILGMLTAVIMLSLEIILVVVEYYLMAVCGILLLPFGMFSETKSFAMRALSGLFAQSFKIIMFIMVLNFLEDRWNQLFIEAVTFDFIALTSVLFQLLILFMLLKRVNAISSALISGSSVSSGAPSVAMAGLTAMAFNKAGGILKDSYSKAGGFSGMKDRFSSSSGGNNTVSAYIGATGGSNEK